MQWLISSIGIAVLRFYQVGLYVNEDTMNNTKQLLFLSYVLHASDVTLHEKNWIISVTASQK